MNADHTPLVRVVVLTFDGGQMTIDCIDSLLATDWPAERMEIVLVDNGSLDDVADRVAAAQPAADIGAVSAKMLFAHRYLGIEVAVPGAATINRNDPRDLGVRVSAVRIDDVRADRRVSFDEDFYGPELPNSEYDEEIARWSRDRGSIRIAVDTEQPLPRVVSLRLSSPEPRTVTLTTDAEQHTLQVGAERTWFHIRLGDEPFDVINNVGSNLYRGGFGGDRGFLERDQGQYQSPAEVFAWCGGAVLLKREYLEQVGLFDEHLFLYYEDTDLSWRGRLQGWRYLYEPTSIVRHLHAASSGVGSPTFRFYTERNRLLVLAKNAPAKVALRAGVGEVRRFVRCMLSAYIGRPLRLQMPERNESAHRRRVLRSYLQLLPAMVRARRAAKPSVDRTALMSWQVTK